MCTPRREHAHGCLAVSVWWTILPMHCGQESKHEEGTTPCQSTTAQDPDCHCCVLTLRVVLHC
eukprot:5609643-Amphidinium_carterae.1